MRTVARETLAAMLRVIAFLLFLLGVAPAAAQSAREGFITTADGVRLFYSVVGAGETTLVVVHGGPAASFTSIEPDFGRFADLYTVIYYDQRGNGRSDLITDSARLGLDRHIADLDAVRAHFGLERMNLLGNSWGGLLAAMYAGAHPNRVERLIMHSPAAPIYDQWQDMEQRIRDRLSRRYTQEQFRRLSEGDNLRQTCREAARMVISVMMADETALPRFRGDLCSGSEDAIRQVQVVRNGIWDTMGRFDLRERARSVTAPTLVIHGAADNIPLAASQAWAAAIPNARLLVVDGSGHLPHVERPEVFFPAVERFIAGDWPEGAREMQ
jgi:proline iminopeptidase